MKKAGFTLTELLVTIAIISVMAMLLTPVLGRARESGRKVQCANNLRQIGIAILLSVDESNGRFPLNQGNPDVGGLWLDYLLARYLDNDQDISICPNYKKYIPTEPWLLPTHQSYGYNHFNAMTGVDVGIGGRDINQIISPSQCIMVADTMADKDTVGFFFLWKDEGTALPGKRHSNGANVLFVDGHIGWYRTYPQSKSAIPVSGDESILWWNY